jgi:uncharacterized protein YcfJ
MKLLITSALLFLSLSPLVQAKHDRSYHNRGEFKANVINSVPVYKYLTPPQPKTYCEPLLIRKQSHPQSHDKTAVIMGGIVGGVIGHATSDKKHQGLGAILGAVIGSTLAHNIKHDKNWSPPTYQVQQQNCAVTYKKAHKIRVLDGYKVTYRLQGKLYRIFMQHKPAKYIQIYN